jgi:hypothetical protein
MNLTEYFKKTCYKSKYEFGTRFYGKYGKIPFIGTGFDTLRSEEQGPIIVVTLDLPIKIKDKLHYVITVKPKDVKVLKQWQ